MFRFMDRFSFYLRRQWNMSHFSVAVAVLMPLSAANVLMFESVWGRTIYIAIIVWAMWYTLNRARDHNRPGNVEAVVSGTFVWVVIAFDVGGFLRYAYLADVAGVLRMAADIVLVTLWGTPGYKVPYEPDNLNYAPGAA